MQQVILDPMQNPAVFAEAYKHKSRPNWDDVFANYDAAVDWPATAFWEDLFTQYPDAKIILTIRDPEDWYESVSKTIRDWPMSEQYQWPERVHQARRMARTIVREGVLKDFADRDATIRQFQDHITRVKSIVPPARLLVMQLGDGWKPLCKFLGVAVPEGIPYPHENKGENFQKKLLELSEAVQKQQQMI
jgi:hypothetical protein